MRNTIAVVGAGPRAGSTRTSRSVHSGRLPSSPAMPASATKARSTPLLRTAWIISALAGGYVNFLRSLPLILVIFWFYVLTPKIVGHPIDAYSSVLVAFILFEAAYYCEIIRAGISSVKRGQVQAGLAMGFSYLRVMRYVILPQALRNMVPVLLTQAIIMFQDTSIVYVVGVRDFLTTADVVATAIRNVFPDGISGVEESDITRRVFLFMKGKRP